MRTSQIVPLLVVLALTHIATLAQAAELTLIYPAPANAVTLTYSPVDGSLSYDGNGVEITTMEIKSATGLFKPERVNGGIIAGPFDVFNPNKFFTLTTAPNQVSAVDIGPVLPAGMTFEEVISDLIVGGSLYPRGGLESAEGGGPYLLQIPEPTSSGILACGWLVILSWCRRSLTRPRSTL